MSDETAGAESAPGGSGADVDPVAVALVLGGEPQSDALLKKQEAFIDDQRHHLREQFKQLDERLKQLRLGKQGGAIICLTLRQAWSLGGVSAT